MKKFNLSRLLFLVFITTILVVSISLSKFTSTLSSSDGVNIALFANDITTTYSLNQKLYPGSDALVIPITVTNKKDGKICEISENFVVEIKNNENENIPLEFGLYKDINCTNQVLKNSNGYYTDSNFKFTKGIEENKIYYLKVNWPSNYNDSAYAFEVDYLIIKFIITQID